MDNETVNEVFTAPVLLVQGLTGIGGIPSAALPLSNIVRESFRGCIRDLSINSM